MMCRFSKSLAKYCGQHSFGVSEQPLENCPPTSWLEPLDWYVVLMLLMRIKVLAASDGVEALTQTIWNSLERTEDEGVARS